MRQLTKLLAVITLLTGVITTFGKTPHWYGSIRGGFQAGTGIELSVAYRLPSPQFPLHIRFALARSKRNPGNALDARHIFINNNSNGVPQKSGRVWLVQFDFIFPSKWQWLPNMEIFVGPRYMWFNGDFRFIGGNEFFNVVCDQWGLGGGVQSRMPLTRKMYLVVAAGLNYFPPATLIGHDTSYSPNGEIVNGREDYTYRDADAAINQPRLEGTFLIGLSVPL